MLIPVEPTVKIVEDNGKPTQSFQVFLAEIARQSTLSGSGSPEGVVIGDRTQMYMDEDGTAGAILYVKKLADISGDRTQGWILV